MGLLRSGMDSLGDWSTREIRTRGDYAEFMNEMAQRLAADEARVNAGWSDRRPAPRLDDGLHAAIDQKLKASGFGPSLVYVTGTEDSAPTRIDIAGSVANLNSMPDVKRQFDGRADVDVSRADRVAGGVYGDEMVNRRGGWNGWLSPEMQDKIIQQSVETNTPIVNTRGMPADGVEIGGVKWVSMPLDDDATYTPGLEKMLRYHPQFGWVVPAGSWRYQVKKDWSDKLMDGLQVAAMGSLAAMTGGALAPAIGSATGSALAGKMAAGAVVGGGMPAMVTGKFDPKNALIGAATAGLGSMSQAANLGTAGKVAAGAAVGAVPSLVRSGKVDPLAVLAGGLGGYLSSDARLAPYRQSAQSVIRGSSSGIGQLAGQVLAREVLKMPQYSTMFGQLGGLISGAMSNGKNIWEGKKGQAVSR